MSKTRLALIAAIFAVFATACGGNVDELAVGDCFMDPEDPNSEIANVDFIDCAEPHHNEVFAVIELDTLVDEASLGDLCIAEFDAYFAQDYALSEVYIFTLSPTADGFANGDNELVCAGYIPTADGTGSELVEGSLQGSGR